MAPLRRSAPWVRRPSSTPASACWVAAVCAVGRWALALDNGVGRRPPQGYNTWNDLGCELLTEARVTAAADALVSSGLRDAGYIYVNLDDCWQALMRNPVTGELLADPLRFPSGIKALGDFLHDRGLRLGIYTDRGPKTCAGRPGSFGREDLDARTFAAWGVDFVKEDNCNAVGGPNSRDSLFRQFGLMRDALNRTGRPMFFSVCGGGDQPLLANLSYYAADPRGGAGLANAWRISSDCISWLTCRSAYEIAGALGGYAGPGGFNDPDMLLGSSAGAVRRLNPARSRTQFSLWAMLMAPLLLGARLADLSAFDLDTYLNKEVIAVSQDGLGKQGFVVVESLWAAIFARELAGGDIALVFVSHRPLHDADVVCDGACWEKLPIASGAALSVRDLWAHRPAEQPEALAGSSYAVRVPPGGGSRMLRLAASSPSSVVV